MTKKLEEMKPTEKNLLMKEVIKQYREAKMKYDLLSYNHNFYPQVNYSTVKEKTMVYNHAEVKFVDYINQKEELQSTVDFYESILMQLDDRSKEIIEKDYLGHQPLWWNETYSKSSYYRAKRKAIDTFLSYLIN